MSGEEIWTAPKAANRLVRIAEAFSNAHGASRFPIDVTQLALGAASIFGWDDPITEIRAAAVVSFEGALVSNDTRQRWLLLYNDSIRSAGRIRFTQAHELGHYILHRQRRESFECSSDDMLNWSDRDEDLEGEADLFASYLLMPFDDYRKQVDCECDLAVLGACADRYGVSLQAATLRWLSYTDEKAVILMSRDGYISWAWSSRPAFRSGAFFKTKATPLPVPPNALASDTAKTTERAGKVLPANVWFPHAAPDLTLREMKIYSGLYESTLTLLVLPRWADVWKPRAFDEET